MAKKNIINKEDRNQENEYLNGFVMVEVVVALAISAIFCSIFVSSLSFIRDTQKTYITNRNAEIILKSIGSYVQRNGKMPYPSTVHNDGLQICDPIDEREWLNNPENYTRGIVPYKTLGISKKYAKDGHGYYFTYLVDPTLCGRKNVKQVPPGDVRERLCKGKNYTGNRYIQYDICFIKKVQLIDFEYNDCPKFNMQNYSSYFAVRSYLPLNVEIDSVSTNRTNVILWDAASRIKSSKLIGYQDGNPIQFDESSVFYHLDTPKVDLDNTKKGWSDIEAELLQKVMISDCTYNPTGTVYENARDEHKVENFIAVVLISHGRSHGGAFKDDGTIVPLRKNYTLEKKINSNFCDNKDKNKFYINKKDGTLEDVVFWTSRFEIAYIYGSFSCRGFEIIALGAFEQEKLGSS